MKLCDIKYSILYFCFILLISINSNAQIPIEKVLNRVSVESEGGLRGLVDIVGFPYSAEQMDYIGELCERLEIETINENNDRFDIDNGSGFIFGISPHDDYALAGRVYTHIQRNIRAKTVILIGNAHWSEAFGIRNRMIFGDFTAWRGPYGNVKVSGKRQDIINKLDDDSYVVNRKLVETEHSLEGIIPFLQYYNRDVEIIPILIPFTDWNIMTRLGNELSVIVSDICETDNLTLGKDIAILCSTDGQHYGDYGWSYYSYFPFGCDIEGYKKATELDKRIIKDYLTGNINTGKIYQFFSELVEQTDISNYKITWCGRFAAPFALNFAENLVKTVENRELQGCLLRYGTSLSDPWLSLQDLGLGVTADANLHHFVTYAAIGFK